MGKSKNKAMPSCGLEISFSPKFLLSCGLTSEILANRVQGYLNRKDYSYDDTCNLLPQYP